MGLASITSVAIILLGVQTLLLIGLILQKSSRNLSYWLLSLILFLFFLTLLNYGAFNILVIFDRAEWIPYLQLELLFGFGPAIYLYTKSLTDKSFQFQKLDWLHFALPSLEFVYYRTPFFRNGAISLSEVATNGWHLLYQVIQWGGLASLICYLVCSIYLLRAYQNWLKTRFSNLEKRALTWLRKPIMIYTLFSCIWLPLRIADILIFDETLRSYYFNLGFLGLAAITCWIGFKGYLTVSTRTEGFLTKEESKNISPDLDHLTRVAEMLKMEMVENKYYLDSDLTLATFSGATGYSQKEISKALNTSLKMSFHEFVNQYRVDAFKSNLVKEEYAHLSLLGLALESGFGSKSTFNLVFKANTGLTPKKYKDQLEKKS